MADPRLGKGDSLYRTPAEAAHEYAARFSGRLVEDEGLVLMFARTRNQPLLAVDTTAAAMEMRRLQDLLSNGMEGQVVKSLRVVHAATDSRTPDFVVVLEDGRTLRVEVRTFTSAPRGYSEPHLKRAEAVWRRQRDVSEGGLVRAILQKAKTSPERPSQLDSPFGGVPIGGDLTIISPRWTLSDHVANRAIARAAEALGPHVLSVTLIFPEAGCHGRVKRVYVRRDGGYLARPPEFHPLPPG